MGVVSKRVVGLFFAGILLVSVLGASLFPSQAEAVPANSTLYYHDGSSVSAGLYTDAAFQNAYVDQPGAWSADGTTLALNGFTFETTSDVGLVMPAGSTLALAEGTSNSIKVGPSAGSAYGIQVNGSSAPALTIKGPGTLQCEMGEAAGPSSAAIKTDGGVAIDGANLTIVCGSSSHQGFGMRVAENMSVTDSSIVIAMPSSPDSLGIAVSDLTLIRSTLTVSGGTAGEKLTALSADTVNAVSSSISINCAPGSGDSAGIYTDTFTATDSTVTVASNDAITRSVGLYASFSAEIKGNSRVSASAGLTTGNGNTQSAGFAGASLSIEPPALGTQPFSVVFQGRTAGTFLVSELGGSGFSLVASDDYAGANPVTWGIGKEEITIPGTTPITGFVYTTGGSFAQYVSMALPEVTSISPDPAVFADSSAGESVMAVDGFALPVAVKLQAFDADGAATGIVGASSGTASRQTANMTFPENTSTSDVVYTVKASLDDGATWEEDARAVCTVTVPAASPTPAPTPKPNPLAPTGDQSAAGLVALAVFAGAVVVAGAMKTRTQRRSRKEQ